MTFRADFAENVAGQFAPLTASMNHSRPPAGRFTRDSSALVESTMLAPPSRVTTQTRYRVAPRTRVHRNVTGDVTMLSFLGVSCSGAAVEQFVEGMTKTKCC